MTTAATATFRGLSPREIKVLACAANGYVDKEIARIIDVQPATIRTYWERLRVKLKAKNRTHAVSIAITLGLVTVDLPGQDLPPVVIHVQPQSLSMEE